MTGLRIEPFSVQVPEATLSDLRERIGKTRWPQPSLEEPWTQGTDLAYLRELLGYWAGGMPPAMAASESMTTAQFGR